MELSVMLRMDISTLRVSELRSLLASARARGHDALAEQIEAEIAGRGSSRRARPAPAFAADEPDEVLPIDVEPLAPAFEFQLSKAGPQPARRWPIGLAVAALLAAGAAVAWGLNGGPALLRGQTPPAAPAAAAASPPPAQRVMTVRTTTTPPPATAPEPPPSVATEAEPAPERPTRLDPCAAPPSPAERLLCNDLALNLLDHEMREAYARAMQAGADPGALRESQAAWRLTRDPVGDPRALAELYDRRIRELRATAAPPSP